MDNQIIRIPKKYGELINTMEDCECWRLMKALFKRNNEWLNWLTLTYYNIIIVDINNIENQVTCWKLWGKKWGRPRKEKPQGLLNEKPPLYEKNNPNKDNISKYNIKEDNISKEIIVANKFATLQEIIKQEFNNDFITDIYNKYKLSKEDFKEECNLFVDYWNEKSINWKRCRWEKEKTFDAKLRFRTWMKNNDKWSKTIIINSDDEERKIKLKELEEKKKLLFNNLKKC